MVLIRRSVAEFYYYENGIVCNKMTDCVEYISLYFNTTLPTQICLKIRILNLSLWKCRAINLHIFFYDFEDSAENLDYLYTGRSFRCQNLKS